MIYKLKPGELAVDVACQLVQNGITHIGLLKYNDKHKCVLINNKDKKTVIKKTKGSLKRHLEVIHCSLVYVGASDLLEGVTKIILCGDLNRKNMIEEMRNILSKNGYSDIDVISKSDNAAHKIANGCLRNRSKYNLQFVKAEELIQSINTTYNININ